MSAIANSAYRRHAVAVVNLRRWWAAWLGLLALGICALVLVQGGGRVAAPGAASHVLRARGMAHWRPSTRLGLQNLPTAAQGPISAALGRHEPAYRIRMAPGGFRTDNVMQGLRVEFRRGAVSVRAGDADLSLAVSAFGAGSRLTPISPASPRLGRGVVRYAHGDLDGWWRDGPLGLEQGFDLSAPPAGAREGAIAIAQSLGGNMRARLAHGAVLLDGPGARLRYAGLSATDARGRTLRSWIELDHHSLVIRVDARRARYPLRIDPFIQQAALTADNGATRAILGAAVAIAGNTIVVGAPGAPEGSPFGGAGPTTPGGVYVFTEPKTGWASATETAELTASDKQVGDELGTSVAIAGNTVFAGAPTQNVGSATHQGAVFVFDKPAVGDWVPAFENAELTAGGGQPGDELGESLSVSDDGDTLVAGAPDENSFTGGAYVFTTTGDTWKSGSQPTELTDSDGAGDDDFGDEVAISGDGKTVVSVGRNRAGGVPLVYPEPATGWASETQSTALEGTDSQVDKASSLAVSSNGSTIAVGAEGVDNTAADQGAVWVYSEPGSGWAGTANLRAGAKLTASDGQADDELGWAVGITGDGATIVASAPTRQVTGLANAGVLYVFDRPTGGWVTGTQTSGLQESLPSSGDYLGYDVAISNDSNTIVAGVPGRLEGTVADAGDALVFANPVPLNTSPPAISPSPVAGEVVSCSTGGWTNNPTGYSYQWSINGTAISGATNPTYAVPAGDVGDSLTCTVTASNADGAAQPATSGAQVVAAPAPPPPPVGPPPSSVSFTISPNVDPLLSHQQVTFAVVNPYPGATYGWDFDSKAEQPGTTVNPATFRSEATGASVTFAYPDPPIDDPAASGAFQCPSGEKTCVPPATRQAVYTVVLRATYPSGAGPQYSTQNVVVVPVQRPTAGFKIIRATQPDGKGASTDVTHPVTIVPQASLPEVDSTSHDSITSEAFWLNGAGPPALPDLICLPNGTCGTPNASGAALTPIPGQADLGTGTIGAGGLPISQRLGCVKSKTSSVCPTRFSPTLRYESFSINFWNRALRLIGSSQEPQVSVEPQLERLDTTPVSKPQETVAYPPLASVNLNSVDGYEGGTGLPFGSCMEGWPLTVASLGSPPGQIYFGKTATEVCNKFPGGPLREEPGPAPNTDLYTIMNVPQEAGGTAARFGPYDLAAHGVNSVQHDEDEWNFLYNYATAIGVDTPLDDTFGPAIGATQQGGKTVPRQITMVAYDAEGVASVPVTQDVPLTPTANPTISGCLQNTVTPDECDKTPAPGAASPLSLTIVAKNKMRFVPDVSSGGDDPILYYAIETGQPNDRSIATTNGAQTQCTAMLNGGSWANPFTVESTVGGGTGNPTTNGGTTIRTQPSAHAVRDPLAARSPLAIAPAAPIATVRSPVAGEGIPVFSDLLAGASPLHLCPSYAARTVDPSAAAPPLPSSGPDVVAARAGQPGSGVGLKPLQSIADPAMVFGAGQPLYFEFPHAGIYSYSIAAYTAAGLGAVTRVDGLEVLPPTPSGFCQTKSSISLQLDHHAFGFSGKCLTVVSAENTNPEMYVSTAPIDINGVPLAPSPGDSIVIKKGTAQGDELYVEPCSISEAQISEINGEKQASVYQPKIDNLCPPTPSKLGSLWLAIGTSTGFTVKAAAKATTAANPLEARGGPGIAYEPKAFSDTTGVDPQGITPTVNADPFWDVSQQPLAKVGHTPAQTTLQSDDNVKNCGLYEQPTSGSSPFAGTTAWVLGPSPQWDHFDVAVAPCVTLSSSAAGGQTSRIAFFYSLPDGFGDGARGQTAPTSPTVLYGVDDPMVSDVSTSPFASVANRRRKPRHMVAGADARTASDAHDDGDDDGDQVEIPSCPADSTSLSSVELPDGTDLGPLSILNAGDAKFCQASNGDFIGDVKVNLNAAGLPIDIPNLEVGFEIGQGRLVNAGGDIGGFPIPPAIQVNELKFDIQTDPVKVAALIDAAIGDVLDVDAQGVIDSSHNPTGDPPSPYADFNGSVSIDGDQFADFEVDFNADDTVGMHVDISQSLAGFSFNIEVSGALGFKPTAFYLEGQGQACAIVCFGVTGLLSNVGMAACGSVSIGPVSVAAGAGVIWSGPNSGVQVFTGCDLTPYIPPTLQNVRGTEDVRATGPPPVSPDARTAAKPIAHPAVQPVIRPNGSEQFQMCIPPADAPDGCAKNVVAVQVHSLVSSESAGQTPLVTLTSPDGKRVIDTPTTPGDYAFSPAVGIGESGQTVESTALVDQDPVPMIDTVNGVDPGDPANDGNASSADCRRTATSAVDALSPNCPRVTATTLFVVDPEPGRWTLTVDAGSPPVVDTSVAVQEVPKPASFDGRIDKVAIMMRKGGAFALRTAGHTYLSSSLPPASRVRFAASLVSPNAAPFGHAASAGKPALALPFGVSPIDFRRLRSVVLKTPSSFVGTVAVLDQSSGGQQVIASGIKTSQVPAGGVPIVFLPNDDQGAQTIHVFLANSQGVPMNDYTLSSFHVPMPRAPEKPAIARVVRDGSTVHVYFKPRNAPIANGIGVTLTGANGEVFALTLPPSRLHAIGALRGIGEATQAPEYEATISGVDPTVPITVTLDTSNVGHESGRARTGTRAAIKSASSKRLLLLHHAPKRNERSKTRRLG